MQNPIEALESKVTEMGDKLEHRLWVRLKRELVLTELSRLITADPDRSANYKTAIDAMG